MYTLCAEHADCVDASCDYLHDNQWDSMASPMWLVDGVTFVADRDDEKPQLSEAGDRGSSEDSEWEPYEGGGAPADWREQLRINRTRKHHPV